MKKILLLMLSITMVLTNSFSQSIMRSQNFNTYDGTSTGAGSGAGDTINYKSGADSLTATTPQVKDGKPFSVYPSPSNGPVQVNFDEPVKQVKFSVYNMIGNEIKNIPMEKISDQLFNFNFRNQQPGFYFIRIQTGKYIYTTRITITAAVAQKRDVVNV